MTNNPTLTLDLVTVRGERAVTNSLTVADRFGKLRSHVLRAISKSEASDEFNRSNFGSVYYLDTHGRRQSMIEMTRDGAMFLIMGFTGAEAARWKEHFIAAFNAAERRLLMPRAPSTEAAGEELIDLRPHWRAIRDMTVDGASVDAIAAATGMSRSAVHRAQQRMHDLGLLEYGRRYRIRALERRLIEARLSGGGDANFRR